MKNEKNKKPRASILAVTLIILGMVLSIALGVSLVSTIENRASISSNKSNLAYSRADSGAEATMRTIREHPEWTVGQIDSDCNGIIDAVDYKIELKDTNGSTITNCNALLSEIWTIKSTGKTEGNQRAIEMVAAADNVYAGCKSYELSGGTKKMEVGLDFGGKSNVCADGNGCEMRFNAYDGALPYLTSVYPFYMFQDGSNNQIATSARNIGTNGDGTAVRIQYITNGSSNVLELHDDCGVGSCTGFTENKDNAFTAVLPLSTIEKGIVTICD
jgi:Tfp pilus assembly protein PilX